MLRLMHILPYSVTGNTRGSDSLIPGSNPGRVAKLVDENLLAPED
jgi:hypothetical protein